MDVRDIQKGDVVHLRLDDGENLPLCFVHRIYKDEFHFTLDDLDTDRWFGVYFEEVVSVEKIAEFKTGSL